MHERRRVDGRLDAHLGHDGAVARVEHVGVLIVRREVDASVFDPRRRENRTLGTVAPAGRAVGQIDRIQMAVTAADIDHFTAVAGGRRVHGTAQARPPLHRPLIERYRVQTAVLAAQDDQAADSERVGDDTRSERNAPQTFAGFLIEAQQVAGAGNDEYLLTGDDRPSPQVSSDAHLPADTTRFRVERDDVTGIRLEEHLTPTDGGRCDDLGTQIPRPQLVAIERPQRERTATIVAAVQARSVDGGRCTDAGARVVIPARRSRLLDGVQAAVAASVDHLALDELRGRRDPVAMALGPRELERHRCCLGDPRRCRGDVERLRRRGRDTPVVFLRVVVVGFATRSPGAGRGRRLLDFT